MREITAFTSQAQVLMEEVYAQNSKFLHVEKLTPERAEAFVAPSLTQGEILLAAVHHQPLKEAAKGTPLDSVKVDPENKDQELCQLLAMRANDQGVYAAIGFVSSPGSLSFKDPSGPEVGCINFNSTVDPTCAYQAKTDVPAMTFTWPKANELKHQVDFACDHLR